MTQLRGHSPSHFLWDWHDRVASIRLNRPERKNPLTFDSYAELRDTFRALARATDVDVVVLAPNGGISPPAGTCTRSSDRWWR
jgi:enoyl-CoA hydratase/carnithine racemase